MESPSAEGGPWPPEWKVKEWLAQASRGWALRAAMWAMGKWAEAREGRGELAAAMERDLATE